MSVDAAEANERLVDRLIAEGALWSPPLIRAFRATPRHHFLERIFHLHSESAWVEINTRDPGQRELDLIYTDRALITHLSNPGPGRKPISSSSQPSLMAEMLEDLNLAPGQRVLEIGAGTGYNAALLAHRVGQGNVVTIDVDRSVLAEAWDHLRAFADRGVRFRHADGRMPLTDEAAFDRIMVTAATPDLEPAWIEQLTLGGRVEAPVELASGLAFVVVGTRCGADLLDARLTRAAYFMPLRSEGDSGPNDEADWLSQGGDRLRAPWAGWFDRRRAPFGWSGFVQALVLFGWLRGLTVHHRAVDDAGSFALADQEGNTCSLGSQHWLVSGSAGEALGNTVYRAFLDAGGPHPWEYRLRVSAAVVPEPGATESYLRRGPRCWHRWEVVEPRLRGPWQ